MDRHTLNPLSFLCKRLEECISVSHEQYWEIFSGRRAYQKNYYKVINVLQLLHTWALRLHEAYRVCNASACVRVPEVQNALCYCYGQGFGCTPACTSLLRICKLTCHLGLSLWEVPPAQSDYRAISVATEVQGTTAGVKGSERTRHTASDLGHGNTETYNTSVDKQLSLSASTEKTEPCPTLVKVYIIGQTSMLEDNEQCWEKLCPPVPLRSRLAATHKHSKSQ